MGEQGDVGPEGPEGQEADVNGLATMGCLDLIQSDSNVLRPAQRGCCFVHRYHCCGPGDLIAAGWSSKTSARRGDELHGCTGWLHCYTSLRKFSNYLLRLVTKDEGRRKKDMPLCLLGDYPIRRWDHTST